MQADWMHDFLLKPYTIRPAVFLRMPQFNMSSEEAKILAAYFAAVDNVPLETPADRMEPSYLAAKEQEYLAMLKIHDKGKYAQALRLAQGGKTFARFDAAMDIVADANYCVQCHIVGDFVPVTSQRALAPDLGLVYKRLRPQYLRDWIAKPSWILPYTAMPENIPYVPGNPHLGGIPQSLYQGTSIDQLDGLVDLLSNFGRYTTERVNVKKVIEGKAGGKEVKK